MADWKKRILTALFVACGFSASPRAFADDEVDASSRRAEEIAARAAELSDQGSWTKAVELFLAAYEVQPAAVLLYNVAVIYDTPHAAIHSPALALTYYRRAASAPDRDASVDSRSLARITELEAKAKPASRDAAPSKPWPPLKTAGAVAVGTGVVALLGTGFFAYQAARSDNDAEALCDGDRCADARALELTNDASTYAKIANITFAAGATLVVSGVVMWLVAPKAPSKAARATLPWQVGQIVW